MAASSLLDVCRFNPTAGSTTDWTYSSAVTGYQSPSAAGVVNGAQYSYRAESADLSQWEIGTGTYNTGTGVLSRTTVLFNSSGGTSKISFTVAPQVAIVALKEDLKVAPTRQIFTSGSGTYTTPANCLYIRVKMIGGGGGGAGTGTSPGAASAGGSSTFNTTTTAPGGSAGSSFNSPGAGGAAGATVDFSIAGASGSPADGTIATPPAGPGGSSVFGGGGYGANPSTAGGAAPANSGAGGGGGGSASGVAGGAGGGAGAYSEKTFTSPSATYAYAVGAGGSGGTAGTSGFAGGAGGSGLIIVDEYYS